MKQLRVGVVPLTSAAGDEVWAVRCSDVDVAMITATVTADGKLARFQVAPHVDLPIDTIGGGGWLVDPRQWADYTCPGCGEAKFAPPYAAVAVPSVTDTFVDLCSARCLATWSDRQVQAEATG